MTQRDDRPASGDAGASTQLEFERRKQQRETAIDARWGRFAGVVKALTDDPQSTLAWAQGASGERRLAAALEDRVLDSVIPLHDRAVPGTRGNIDHLLVGPSGVWIVDAKAHNGQVECRDVGRWLKTDLRLFIAGRDQTRLVDGMAWQVDAVRRALEEDDTPVHPVLCFTNAEWKLLSKPFTIKGVRCTWAKKLAEAINQPGPLTDEQVVAIATRLAEKLPSKT